MISFIFGPMMVFTGGDPLKRADLSHLAARPDTPLLFYCNGERCLRSSHAAKMAVNWGYTRVYWFRGGWQEWLDKQLPVTR